MIYTLDSDLLSCNRLIVIAESTLIPFEKQKGRPETRRPFRTGKVRF
jgi:hypothetical protein